ncbi:MAG: restriction endonuclease subunit S [Proteobacteria bacterium]|nr:restriction endonuclease subunit S [Pseudomonadota bacterium]
MNVVFFGFKREGLAYLDQDQADQLANVEVRAGDVLLNITGASIGRVTVAPDDMDGARVNQHVCIIRPNQALDNRFLVAFLSSPQMQAKIGAENYGMTRQALTKQQILEFQIPLPPLAEQQRIADLLGKLIIRVAACRGRLDTFPKILNQFREAVLEAAVSGKLTEEWRKENPKSRIEDELSEIHMARSATWADNNRGSLKAATQPLAPYISEIPKSWRWASIDRLASQVVDGTHFTPKYQPRGVPFISVKDVRKQSVFFDDCRFISAEEHHELAKRCNPQMGDLLVTKSGTIGRTAIVADEREFSLFVSVALVKPIRNHVSVQYMEIAFEAWMDSIDVASEITGSGMKNLHIRDLRRVPVPLPPLKEQMEIVRRCGELFACVDGLGHRYTSAMNSLDKCVPAILAKAFRGELVSQDPMDEPASVLLERIRKGREKRAVGKGSEDHRNAEKRLRSKISRPVTRSLKRTRSRSTRKSA